LAVGVECRHQDGDTWARTAVERARSDAATHRCKNGVPIFVCVVLSTLLYCGLEAFLQFSSQQRSKAPTRSCRGWSIIRIDRSVRLIQAHARLR